TDPDRDWRRAEHRYRPPDAERHDAATHRPAGRQRPGVDGTGKDLTILFASGDAALDVATIAILSIVGGLYVLANFGERNTTARMITLIVGGGMSAIALLAGLLVAVNNVAQYAVGAVRPEQFRTNEL